MFQDWRQAVRSLFRYPGFSAIAVITLAVGIAANVIIFSVVNAVLLRPLPYPEADRLVFLWSESPMQNLREKPTAYATYAEWRQQNRSFEDLAAFDPTSVTLTGEAEPEQVMSVRASANVFSLLGATPIIGRTFTPDETEQKTRVVILSYALWQRRFGSSPNVLGQSLEIDGTTSQIIGVMPEAFQFFGEANPVFEPLTLARDWEAQKAQHGTGSWRVIGRLKPDVSLQQAQTEMAGMAQRLELAYPDANQGLSVNIVPFYLQLTGSNLRLSIWILFGAVVLVLLIACSNVASLMLARGLARQREIAIRMALGAGRMRLIRQLLVESTLLALLAAAVGLLLATWGTRALVALSPLDIPRLVSAAIDVKVLLFTIFISILTAIGFGLVPALKISQSHPGEALKEGRSTSGGISARRLRRLMVVAEFSLAMLLLLGAGLLVRSFMRLQAVDPGFDAAGVLVVQTAPPRTSTADQWRAFYQQARERIASLPGVQAVGLTEEILVSGNPESVITVEGRLYHELPPLRTPLRRDAITDGFFQALRVPLRQGRNFNQEDTQTSLPVAIVNETLARRYWPNGDALGKRFKLGAAQSDNPWLTVVGVVGDMRRQSLERQPIAQVFLPHLQSPERRMNFIIRTTADSAQLAPAVRNELHSLDKSVVVYGVSTLESRLAVASAQRRFQTWLLTLFSVLALLLAAIGIYGLLHQSVVLRTREIGTRLALGASPTHVWRLVVGEGIRLALCGVAVGVGASLGLTRVLAGLLFGVTPTDAATYVAVPLVLLLTALLACWLPARRAAKVDPMVALRYE
jgi:predicted permease